MNRSCLRTASVLLAMMLAFVGCQSNKAPAAPVLTGPPDGQTGAGLYYSVTAADPDNDSVSYRVAWGDGDTSGWSELTASGGAITLTHLWVVADTYSLTGQARDTHGNESPWSAGLQLIVVPAVTNEAPAAPALTGPDTGYMHDTLNYTVVSADPENDMVAYRVAWGDGDTSDWSQNVASGESVTISHSWDEAGTYTVAGQAKDKYGHRSDWSAGLTLAVLTPEYPSSVIAAVSVGSSPYGLCATIDGQFVYVANYNDNTVSIIRTSDNQESKRFILNGRPSACVPSPDGQYVYISCSAETSVARIRTSDNSLVKRLYTPTDPWEMAISPDGSYLYAGLFRTSSYKVAILNLADDSAIAAPVVAQNPWGMALTPDGAFLYVASRDGDAVAVLRTADSSLVGTIPVGLAPNGLAMSPDGQFVYVVAESSAAVYVIRTADNTVVDSISVPGQPTGITVLPDGKYIYVSNYGADYVSVIRASGFAVVKQITVGGAPDRCAVSPDGSKVYVVTRQPGKVAVIGY